MSKSIKQGSGMPLVVWVMQDDFSSQTIEAINKEFTRRTNVKVEVQVQPWAQISTKIMTSLVTSSPPDVLDIGNTKLASFAQSGGLADLSRYKRQFDNHDSWLAGLAEAGEFDNHLYGVPAFGATRAVIYNKKLWAQAGIVQPPATYKELIDDLNRISEVHKSDKDFSAFYLPAKNWFLAMQFIWDFKGNVFDKSSGVFRPSMSSKASLRGLQEWRLFQNSYSSKASRVADANSPDMAQMMAENKTSAIFSNSASLKRISEINPQISQSDLGTFPFPSALPDRQSRNEVTYSKNKQPAVLSGSLWAVAARSPNADLAAEWISIATGSYIQRKYLFSADKWIPNNTNDVKKVLTTLPESDNSKGFFEAALLTSSTPALPLWSHIEEDSSMKEMLVAIASSRKDGGGAARVFDNHLEDLLKRSGDEK
ncbi:extracellular solute-binding protein [Alloscardovia venturai]|uniref:Extracellular solute-binding protein n=1 Tax=Alloscardovia venturai TaxID=1769421 RepID=A0ABW2Y5P0_9BIFI